MNIFTNPELLPVSFLLYIATHRIFSEAGISVDEEARGAILALVARLTDGVGTDSSPSDSSVALDDSSSSSVSVFLRVYDL